MTSAPIRTPTGGAEFLERRKHLRLVTRDGTLTIDGVPVGPIFGSTMPRGGVLDFPTLLGVLGYIDSERLSVAHRNGSRKNGGIITAVMPLADVPSHVAGLPPNHDIYFGVNPVAEHVRSNGAKGKADDVTRLVVLPVDLDVKDNGCRDLTHAHAIIDELSEIVGTRPVAVIHSGKGLQPLWGIVDGGRNDTIDIKVILNRWGQLAKATAKAHDANIDGIFNLDRILRVPGTFNCKYVTKGEGPIPVVCHVDTGRALALAEINEKLGTVKVDGETKTIGEPVSSPDDWTYGDETCPYAENMVKGWNGDLPKSGRHQWLLNQSVRLACAWRLGCITEADHRNGYEGLARRIVELRSATGEFVPGHELVKAFAFGAEIAATKTYDEARRELGGHKHRWPAPDHPYKCAKPVVAAANREEEPLRYWNGTWFTWCGTHYQVTTVERLRDKLYELLADAEYVGSGR